MTLRAKFEHSKRTGSGFDEALLEEVGEQPDMRHFDIADRNRDRVDVTLTITPIAMFDVNASVSTGKDDYPNSGFGLRDNKNNTWSVGFDVVPTEVVSFGLNYGEETYKAIPYSRTANPLTATDVTFNDPNRDWWHEPGRQGQDVQREPRPAEGAAEDRYPGQLRPQRRRPRPTCTA